jgi:hypothetical protein
MALFSKKFRFDGNQSFYLAHFHLGLPPNVAISWICKFLLLPFLAVTFSVEFFTEQHLLTAHNFLTDYILGKEIRTF